MSESVAKSQKFYGNIPTLDIKSASFKAKL